MFQSFKFALTSLMLVTSLSIFASTESVRVDLEVEKWVLPNGLTVLFHEDHSTPLVSYQQWYRVGSKDEVVGQTGLAHFFEHLMFKGSQNFSKDTFNRVLNAKGANFNAFTSGDYTGYYINAPTENLDYLIKVEADRMRRLLFDEAEIQTEREVVKEERRVRYENSPEGFLWIALPELMYQNLPYRWPTIGSMEDLNKAKLEDFKKFYTQYYAPNNAVIVVAGHFNKAQAKKLIEKEYGGFESQAINRPEFKPEPEQTKPRSKDISWKVQSPILSMAYPTATIKNPDSYALEILGAILGDGSSSRLHQKLVYVDQLATSVSSFNYPQELAGRMIFTANLKKGVASTTVKKLIENEISKVVRSGVKPEELEKAKNQLLTSQVESLKKVSGRARSLAFNEIVFGDYKRLFTDLERYLEVTDADIRRVAKTYLVPQKLNFVTVKPE